MRELAGVVLVSRAAEWGGGGHSVWGGRGSGTGGQGREADFVPPGWTDSWQR